MVKKLMIFGDSVMQGVVFSEESGRYKLCRNSFETLSTHGIEVKNKSKMGSTIIDGIGNIERFRERIDRETLVLLEFGGNDCDFAWNEVSEKPTLEHLPNVIPEVFFENYRRAIEILRELGASVAVATLVPIDSEKYFRRITSGLSCSNILSWLGDVTMISRWQEFYNKLVEKIAVYMSCPIIDIRERFLCVRNYSECICADGIHPSELGHKMIENVLTDSVLKLC